MASKWMARKSSLRNPILHHAAMTVVAVAEEDQDLAEGLRLIQVAVVVTAGPEDHAQAATAGVVAVVMTATDHPIVTGTAIVPGNATMMITMTNPGASGSN